MRNISEGRKTAYYIGMVIMIIGFLSFGSVFVSAISNTGNFDNFQQRSKSMGTRAFGGIVLIAIGGVIMGIGAKGAAGSGLILDPKKAREDLEPYTRMAGGMVKDALDEADEDPDHDEQPDDPHRPLPVVEERVQVFDDDGRDAGDHRQHGNHQAPLPQHALALGEGLVAVRLRLRPAVGRCLGGWHLPRRRQQLHPAQYLL